VESQPVNASDHVGLNFVVLTVRCGDSVYTVNDNALMAVVGNQLELALTTRWL
jgi:hypothetical protein